MLRIPPKWVSAGMLLTMSCIFSLSFLFATLASMEVGPAASGSTRIVFAAIFLVIAAQITGVGLVRGRQLWAYAAIYGIICLGMPFTLLPWTLTYVSNTTAAIYYAAIPLEVLVLSRIVIGTPISRQKWAGFAIAFAGLLLLAHIGAQGDAGASQAVVEQLGVADRLAENQLWIPHLLCNLCALCPDPARGCCLHLDQQLYCATDYRGHGLSVPERTVGAGCDACLSAGGWRPAGIAP